MKRLSKRALGCMYVATALGSILILAVLATLNIFWFFPEEIQIGKLITFILGGIVLVHTGVSPYFRYQRYRYDIGEEFIDIREGYLFVNRQIVPIQRLHKMETIRGPIDQLFHVAKVKLTTAGGDVTIRFLEEEKAQQIAESLGIYINQIVKEQREKDGEE